MNYSPVSTTWARLKKTAKILILTERERLNLAQKIKEDNLPYVTEIHVIDINVDNSYDHEMHRLTENDLLLVLLTTEGFMHRGHRNKFSLFSKPSGTSCKYIFIRLDIPEASLVSGLNTDIKKVQSIVDKCRAFGAGKRVRVTTDIGTDITVQIDHQILLPCIAEAPGSAAILPPAEISEALVPFSSNGTIVADITVGELRFGADLIDSLGIVDRNVVITVENGLVKDITGGDIACRLKSGLDRLEKSYQVLVELGHGLSDIVPTGIIGVDESMNGTCHFGIGSRDPYHVDVVVSNPEIVVLEE